MARGLVVVWMLVVAVASLSSGSGEVLGDGPGLHALAYMVLAWLLRHLTAGRSKPWRILAPLGIALGFGALMELVQMALPYRTAELRDLLANGVGAAVALLLPLLPFLVGGGTRRSQVP